MADKQRLIVVEDDAEVRTLLTDYLLRQGFAVEAADGGAALDRILSVSGPPDLIVLDLMMPGEDGLSIVRRLRAATRIPMLMLTARADDIDRIVGLEMGADDYMAKPFNPRELVARIRSILRRMEPAPLEGERYEVAGMVVDIAARRATRGDAVLDLTSAEFDLLACFVTRPQRVLSRDQLMDWTRGRKAEPLDRAIDVQMSRLRKKMDDDSGEIIKTVRNAGYVLTLPVKKL
ncbi:MAG: response regulator [Alphaproteobacteria bacterium]|nr:response regulator [Alphaproteobacteria bacterium]